MNKSYTIQPADFPNPTAVDPTRPKESYQLQGAGFHNCPGVDFAADTIPEIIKIIFTLPGLRRAPNPAGTCASFNLNKLGTDNKMYVTSTGNWSPWPGSLIVAVSSAFLFLFSVRRDAFFADWVVFCSMTPERCYESIYFRHRFFLFSKLMFTCLHLYINLSSIHIIFIVAAVYNIS